MSNELKNFTVKILIASLVLLAFGWAVFTFVVPTKYIPVLPWMLAFFAFVTILTHGFLMQMAKKDMARFARNSMLISLLRLFLYSLFTFIYLAINTDNAAVFVVCLVVVYLVFTFFNVAELARITRNKNRKE